VLLAAAGLKLGDEGLQAAEGFGPFASPGWRLVLIETESFLGTWLLLGWASGVLWFVALLFFAGLAGASLFLGVDGQESCRCFGTRLLVPPWYTAAGDALAIAALLLWRPLWTSESRGCRGSRWLRRVGVLLACVPGAVIGLLALTGGWAAEGRWLGDERPSFLDPEKWSGKRFPLLPYIDIREELEHGRWLVVLYQHGCSKCDKVISDCREAAGDALRGPTRMRLALVEVSLRSGADPGEAGMQDFRFKRGVVKDANGWQVATPAVLVLEEGYVSLAKTSVLSAPSPSSPKPES
jgi:hypothetical protein